MIKDLFTQKKPILSFEVFPPKKEEEFERAYEVLNGLAKLEPDFISVTYGAGGSRSKKTIDIASYIHNTLGIPTLAHLTCVGVKKEDIMQVYEDLKAANVSHVLALRGDRPQMMSDEQFNSRDFMYATDLIDYLHQNTDLHIAGACYPEKHFEAISMRSDISHLKEKVDAGVEFLITQLFFDNDAFYSFREKTQAAGINVPICAGIMPITSAKQLGTTVTLSGTSIPKAFSDIVAKYGESPEDMRKAGIDYAIRQLRDLRDDGVDGLHIYSMNKPKTTAQIIEGLK